MSAAHAKSEICPVADIYREIWIETIDILDKVLLGDCANPAMASVSRQPLGVLKEI